MLEIITAGGWLMLPILTCSVVAMAIVVERCWTLRKKKVLPDELLELTCRLLHTEDISSQRIAQLQNHSPLGRVLAAGLAGRHKPAELIKKSIEETGSHVSHELQRFLNALGTIATVTPLLGLLGTVLGMITVFTRITSAGVGNPGELAGGISQALITTAAGLSVAIPSLIMHRYFRSRIEKMLIMMEQQALKLVETIEATSLPYVPEIPGRPRSAPARRPVVASRQPEFAE